MSIHPTAIVDAGAEVDPGAEIGPYAIVGAGVRLAEGVVLRAHASVVGHTEVGAGTEIFSFASIGEQPQDKKYKGEKTTLKIGKRNLIREHVTINPGTAHGGGQTTVGDDNMLMIQSHIGHDCQIGNHVEISNLVLLAGHVIVEDYAVLGGRSGAHQFCRIGESSMLAATTGMLQDLAPFTIGTGLPTRVIRMNQINLERRGFTEEQVKEVALAFRLIFRSGLRPQDAFAEVRSQLPQSAAAERMVAFLEKSERGFARVR